MPRSEDSWPELRPRACHDHMKRKVNSCEMVVRDRDATPGAKRLRSQCLRMNTHGGLVLLCPPLTVG
ncbi:hypothetical protein AcW1_002305 [Taiwanofungus camphoratus]|nr:hypothetical protein AcW1_002305 [Antrodia cinnamomea]